MAKCKALTGSAVKGLNLVVANKQTKWSVVSKLIFLTIIIIISLCASKAGYCFYQHLSVCLSGHKLKNY